MKKKQKGYPGPHQEKIVDWVATKRSQHPSRAATKWKKIRGGKKGRKLK